MSGTVYVGACLFVFAIWARSVLWLADRHGVMAAGLLAVAAGALALGHLIWREKG